MPETRQRVCSYCDGLFQQKASDRGRKCYDCIKNYKKQWEAANAGKMAGYRAAYYRANKPYYKKYAEDNRERFRSSMLLHKYGINLEQYKALLAKQRGCCAICGTKKSGGKTTTLRVDHCHKTGRVRGLLCHSCNAGIGYLQDSFAVVAKAAEYLKPKFVLLKRNQSK